MIIKYANRAKTQLARSISANEGIISVISGQGSLFPSLTQGAQLFPLTLVSIADQSQFEICYVLARNADSMTVLRGQEGTTAQAFESGDIVSLNMTASVFGLFPQAGYLGVYDPDIARTIGGYKKNAVLADGNIAGTLWLSLQDNNKTPPSHEATSWWLKLDFVSLGTQLGSFVSGLLGMRPQDKQGISLFTNGDNGLPVYSDVAGHKIDLAPQSTLDKVNKDLQGLKNHAVISDAWSSDDTSISSIRIMHNQPHNRVGVVSADGKHDLILPNIDNLTDLNNDLQSFKADAVTGHGYSDGDQRVTNIWANNDKEYPRLQANIGTNQTLITARIEDITKETTRAQSAEATLVSGHYGIRPGASPARAILLSENGNISVCALVNDADQWVELLSTPNAASTYQLRGDYATNPALDDAVANVVKSHAYASTDAVISAIRVWMTGDNGNPMLVAQTKDSDDFRCASVESVRNETTRATSAEATLVSGHYGVGTGSSPVRSAIGNDKGGLSVCFDKSGDVWEAFLTENSVRETTLGITGRYSMQRFSATIKDNQWVSVPTPFSDDDVVYIVSPLISKNFINWVGVNFDATTPKNKNGFTARIYSGRGDGGVIHWSPFTLVFDVIAIGKM
ncbi:hypothetical protein [Aristophania vespae]|uniref:hypothetical protein n=1 Tax=Aristophania vespae TaxID=2697033 RepID=UPI0023513EFC|nr:hypothetical protein [Aristophania vespae]UMM63155.1 hypothetical protein DM15PD_01100 [Aristophania vespae]